MTNFFLTHLLALKKTSSRRKKSTENIYACGVKTADGRRKLFRKKAEI